VLRPFNPANVRVKAAATIMANRRHHTIDTKALHLRDFEYSFGFGEMGEKALGWDSCTAFYELAVAILVILRRPNAWYSNCRVHICIYRAEV